MTATVTAVTRMTILMQPYGLLSASLGLIVILLLLALLVEKELRRAIGGSRVQMWLEALDIAIIPLVLAAGLIMFLRLINLIVPL